MHRIEDDYRHASRERAYNKLRLLSINSHGIMIWHFSYFIATQVDLKRWDDVGNGGFNFSISPRCNSCRMPLGHDNIRDIIKRPSEIRRWFHCLDWRRNFVFIIGYASIMPPIWKIWLQNKNAGRLLLDASAAYYDISFQRSTIDCWRDGLAADSCRST